MFLPISVGKCVGKVNSSQGGMTDIISNYIDIYIPHTAFRAQSNGYMKSINSLYEMTRLTAHNLRY